MKSLTIAGLDALLAANVAFAQADFRTQRSARQRRRQDALHVSIRTALERAIAAGGAARHGRPSQRRSKPAAKTTRYDSGYGASSDYGYKY